MFAKQFEYTKANSVSEAIQLLGNNEGAKLLAGGHSLLPMMKLRLSQPSMLIDIGGIGEMRGISDERAASALPARRPPRPRQCSAGAAPTLVRRRPSPGADHLRGPHEDAPCLSAWKAISTRWFDCEGARARVGSVR